MDIEYLLFLQNWRNATNNMLTPFMEWISLFAVTYLILILELIISIICLWMTVAGFRQGNVGIGFPIFTAVSIALDLIVWIAIAVRHNRM